MTTSSQFAERNARRPLESGPIRRELRERLLALNFHAFARCMALLLEQIGYKDVQLAGRTNWRGKNRYGGFDIEASLPVGLGTRRVLVQVKQFDTQPIFQRAIDELRGVCLRVGASEALIITTGQFAPSVERAASRLFEPPIAPVRFLDGEALLEQMISHRVGIWEEPGGTRNEPTLLGVDTAFFEELSKAHSGNSRSDSMGGRVEPGLLVTVQVKSLRRIQRDKIRKPHSAAR